MDEKGSFRGIFIIMIVSLLIASFWNSIPLIKNSVNAVLNPSAGALLNWNLTYGMIILVFILALFMTLVQKYTTDQKTLRELKEEQKSLQQQMKKLEAGSKEYTELSMKSMKAMGPMFKLSMRPIIYTAIPIILLFRWFADYFALVNFRFFGLLSWFWFYLIGSIIFSSILRKILKVV
ncbi:MAG: EMC3/TMCO1 family protein [Candidatus Pacearchaeota archaeon]|nr:EMC3/TMCO1 family protein [Candidatus Pacearchaeota archaeon]